RLWRRAPGLRGALGRDAGHQLAVVLANLQGVCVRQRLPVFPGEFAVRIWGSPPFLLIDHYAGRPKQSRTRRRKWSKFTIPKARRRSARSPVLKPSVRPLLERLTK